MTSPASRLYVLIVQHNRSFFTYEVSCLVGQIDHEQIKRLIQVEAQAGGKSVVRIT